MSKHTCPYCLKQNTPVKSKINLSTSYYAHPHHEIKAEKDLYETCKGSGLYIRSIAS